MIPTITKLIMKVEQLEWDLTERKSERDSEVEFLFIVESIIK